MATKKRLIFTLLYSDGYFCQSRNFRCQKVGDFDWLFNNYKFSKITSFLDELVVINVNPIEELYQNFLNVVKHIVENVFIPVQSDFRPRPIPLVEDGLCLMKGRYFICKLTSTTIDH